MTEASAKTIAKESTRSRDWTSLYVYSLAALSFLVLMVASYAQLVALREKPESAFRLLLGIAFFTAVGIFADIYKVRISPGSEVSAGFLADFLSGALMGPFAAFWVAGLGAVLDLRKGLFLRSLFQFALFSTTAAITSVVFRSIVRNPDDLLLLVVGGICAGFVYQLTNFILAAPVAWTRTRLTPMKYWNESFRPYLVFHFFFLVLSLSIIYVYQSVPSSKDQKVWILFLLPVLGLVYAFRMFARERELSGRLERFSLEMAASMVTALDMKDNYTAQHSAAVAQYSFDIAKCMGVAEQDCYLAHLAGLLHDVGKISIRDDVLNSPDVLDDTDWCLVKGHPQAGQHILSNITEFGELADIILYHHERYDGQGYPCRLGGDDIPLISRIVAVADSYSAMISDRPYRRRLPVESAVAEIERKAGSQFDPQVAAAFVELLGSRPEAYRSAQDVDFRMEFQKVRFLRDLVERGPTRD